MRRAPEDAVTDTQILLENRPPSLATHFLQRVEATPDGEAYRYPVPSASGTGPDDWRPLTWRESADRVFAIVDQEVEEGTGERGGEVDLGTVLEVAGADQLDPARLHHLDPSLGLVDGDFAADLEALAEQVDQLRVDLIEPGPERREASGDGLLSRGQGPFGHRALLLGGAHTGSSPSRPAAKAWLHGASASSE